MTRGIFLFIFSMTIFSWGDYADDAYRLIKKGEYEQAYKLYSLAYRDESNIKAAYNMAVMIEKQYVHDRDILNYQPKEAAKWYKIVADSVPETKDLKPEYCAKEMYPYYLKTFDKLSKWYKKGHFVKRSDKEAERYRQRASELKRYCKKYPNYKHSAIPHYKSTEEENAESYLKKCPAAKVIPQKNRIGIDDYKCVYYKRFPKKMKQILDLHQDERLIHSPTAQNDDDEKHKKINQKARKIARPVLSYIIKNKIIPCYKTAKTKSDLNYCYNYYLNECQKLTFGDIIACTSAPESNAGEKTDSDKATDEDRKKAIREIKEMMKKGDICPVLIDC